MNTLPDNELDLDKLFLPAWAQEPPSAKHYAHYEGGEEVRESRDDRRGQRRPPRREAPSRDRRENRPYPSGRPERRGAASGRFSHGERQPGFRHQKEERREPLPLPEINVIFLADEKGVESLARQIKTTGRAYPLFDIARLILERPERYSVAFAVKKNAEGRPVQPLFLCMLDDSLWLSEDEAVGHVLKDQFNTFYQSERTATEPPKGKYTFVAQCGMSGVILGPPNYHDYQNQLRKLHAERFSRMPFETFKSRVKIVSDEAVVKKWIEDKSFKTEFVCLNMPEPLRLPSREEVEKHFREVHKENIIKQVESHTLSGSAARSLRSPDLLRLVRQGLENQRRFPLQIATALSQQFAQHGLQFFKVNRTITHVSVARPHYLDLETTPVSDGVKRIVDVINATPKCTRRKLFQALAPSPVPPTSTPAEHAAPAQNEPAAPPAAVEPNAEQTAIIADLHWLIHQGHVIEFANGVLETAKKPLPKPPKPEKKPADQPARPEQIKEAAPSSGAPIPVEQAPSEAELANESPTSSLPSPTEEPAVQPSTESPVEAPAAPTETHS